MTGDGVNHVLAVKEADCSIAMAGGSDAAKNIANVVLLDSSFSAMPDIVNQGRRVVNNIRTAASMFLIKTMFSVMLALISILLGRHVSVRADPDVPDQRLRGRHSHVLPLPGGQLQQSRPYLPAACVYECLSGGHDHHGVCLYSDAGLQGRLPFDGDAEYGMCSGDRLELYVGFENGVCAVEQIPQDHHLQHAADLLSYRL